MKNLSYKTNHLLIKSFRVFSFSFLFFILSSGVSKAEFECADGNEYDCPLERNNKNCYFDEVGNTCKERFAITLPSDEETISGSLEDLINSYGSEFTEAEIKELIIKLARDPSGYLYGTKPVYHQNYNWVTQGQETEISAEDHVNLLNSTESTDNDVDVETEVKFSNHELNVDGKRITLLFEGETSAAEINYALFSNKLSIVVKTNNLNNFLNNARIINSQLLHDPNTSTLLSPSDFESLGGEFYVYKMKEITQEIDGYVKKVKVFPASPGALNNLINTETEVRVGLAVCNEEAGCWSIDKFDNDHDPWMPSNPQYEKRFMIVGSNPFIVPEGTSLVNILKNACGSLKQIEASMDCETGDAIDIANRVGKNIVASHSIAKAKSDSGDKTHDYSTINAKANILAGTGIEATTFTTDGTPSIRKKMTYRDETGKKVRVNFQNQPANNNGKKAYEVAQTATEETQVERYIKSRASSGGKDLTSESITSLANTSKVNEEKRKVSFSWNNGFGSVALFNNTNNKAYTKNTSGRITSFNIGRGMQPIPIWGGALLTEGTSGDQLPTDDGQDLTPACLQTTWECNHDGDERISRAEATVIGYQNFDYADVNNDGYIDKNEWENNYAAGIKRILKFQTKSS